MLSKQYSFPGRSTYVANESTDRQTESVLVPTGNDPEALTCVRSLGRRGLYTVVATPRGACPASSSRHCDEVFEVPSPRDDLVAYKDALLGVAERDDVETVLPVTEADVYALSQYRDAFDDVVSVVVPPPETLAVVHDRMWLFRRASAAGVPVPETRLLDDVDDWSEGQVIKPRYAVLADAYVDGRSPADFDSESDVSRYVEPGTEPDREAVVDEMGHVPIVQDYVPGAEYGFLALYDGGEPVATSQKRQLRGSSYAGGASVYRKTVDRERLEIAGRRLLTELDWHGLAEVEFLRSPETCEFVLMEVNPRTWGSIRCSVLAGADYPYFYWLLATGESDAIDPSYRPGVATHNLFGEMSYLRSVLRDDNPFVDRPALSTAVAEVLSSCLQDPNFDYLNVHDLAPVGQAARINANARLSPVVNRL